jgi:arylsulfatase A-like enzyme
MWSATTILSIVVAVVAIIYFHPGTEHAYISYTPGLAKLYLCDIIPFQEVTWNRIEIDAPHLHSDKNKQPNIIIIIADDLGYNDLSGGAGVMTPYIDSIRENGVTFTQAYAGHATCSPARASLLTGRYPNRFGYESLAVSSLLSWTISRPKKTVPRQPVFHYNLLSKVPDDRDMMIPPSEIMISDVLRNASYTTVHVGKWHLGERKGMLVEERYDEVVGFAEGAAMYAYPPDQPGIVNERLSDALDKYLWINLFDFVQHNGSARFPAKEYMTDYLAKQTAAAIRTKMTPPSDSSKAVPPLFMTVAFNAPHTPLQAKKEDYDSPEFQHLSHVEKVYAGMIKALDRGVGTILDAVEATGQANNTLVIFTSDNGGPGYVGIPQLNHPFRGWKATFFEGGFRVPMFMSWPGVFTPGTEYSRPVGHVDIFSTVLAAASIDIEPMKKDRVYDGVDLRPYVDAKQSAFRRQRSCEDADEQCEALPQDDTLNTLYLEDPHESLFWRTGSYTAFRHGDWKIQATWLPDRVWLTDLLNDPTERKNLAAGLLWSAFKSILDNSTSQLECCELLTKFVQANATLGHLDGQDLVSRLCVTGQRMMEVNAEQAEPLWPALTEVPMPVDSATATVQTLEEEHVYWAL